VTYFGLKRSERIKKRYDFLSLIRKGKKISASFLSLSYKKRSAEKSQASAGKHLERKRTRLGISVPKRLLKKAHDRNRVKRLIREVFRLEKHRINVPIDLIVYLKQPLKETSFKSVQKEIRCLLKKGNLIS
jgi:ribonuclease P protein component